MTDITAANPIAVLNDRFRKDPPQGVPIAGNRLFWKIDYYADAAMEWGAEDPSDPAASFRVLTVMLASEY